MGYRQYSTQFLAAASANPDHPCHYMLAHQPTPHSIKTTPQALYTGFLNTIPQHSRSHIHTHFTNLAIQKLGPNTILGTPSLKYTTQNSHYHMRTEYPCGSARGLTLVVWGIRIQPTFALVRVVKGN